MREFALVFQTSNSIFIPIVFVLSDMKSLPVLFQLSMHHIGQRLRLPHSDGGGGEQAVLGTTENSSRAYEVFFLVGLINRRGKRRGDREVRSSSDAMQRRKRIPPCGPATSRPSKTPLPQFTATLAQEAAEGRKAEPLHPRARLATRRPRRPQETS